MGIKQRFTEHPNSVDETYGEHLRVALHFSRELAAASVQAAVHAFLPFLYRTSASTKVKQLHTEMTTGNRAARPEAEPALAA